MLKFFIKYGFDLPKSMWKYPSGLPHLLKIQNWEKIIKILTFSIRLSWGVTREWGGWLDSVDKSDFWIHGSKPLPCNMPCHSLCIISQYQHDLAGPVWICGLNRSASLMTYVSCKIKMNCVIFQKTSCIFLLLFKEGIQTWDLDSFLHDWIKK